MNNKNEVLIIPLHSKEQGEGWQIQVVAALHHSLHSILMCACIFKDSRNSSLIPIGYFYFLFLFFAYALVKNKINNIWCTLAMCLCQYFFSVMFIFRQICPRRTETNQLSRTNWIRPDRYICLIPDNWYWKRVWFVFTEICITIRYVPVRKQELINSSPT